MLKANKSPNHFHAFYVCGTLSPLVHNKPFMILQCLVIGIFSCLEMFVDMLLYYYEYKS